MYLNGVTTFIKIAKEYIARVEKILLLLNINGVSLKLKSCSFSAENNNYLGTSSGHAVRNCRSKKIAIQEPEYRTTQMEVWSFRSHCNVSRRFVQGSSKHATPLNQKLQRDRLKSCSLLTRSKTKIVDELKQIITSSLVLALWKPMVDCNVNNDDFDTQIPSVLLERPLDANNPPFAYWSWNINDSESKLAPNWNE